MSLSSIDDATIGATISFKSKNPTDLVNWQGVLISKGNYLSIRGYENPAAYNQAVRQVDPSVPSDVQQLNYFLLQLKNGSDVESVRAFSEEWIQPGSLNELALGSFVTIKVSDPYTNPDRIISLLASSGYSATIQQE